MTKLPDNLLKAALTLEKKHPEDIVAVYGLDTKNIWASRSHESILGYPPAEVHGHPWTKFVHPGDHAHADLAGNDALLHGQSIEFGLRAVTKSGAPVSLRGKAWIAADTRTGMGFLFFQARRHS
jgi:PAS domain S-box-containing protein